MQLGCVFEDLAQELLCQRANIHNGPTPESNGQALAPLCCLAFRPWNWRLHTLRATVLFHLRTNQEAYSDTLDRWPEQIVAEGQAACASGGAARLDEEGLGESDGTGNAATKKGFFNGTGAGELSMENPVVGLALAILADEAKLNWALERASYVPPTERFRPLSTESALWKVKPRDLELAHLATAGAAATRTLGTVMGILVGELVHTWSLARETHQQDIIGFLENELPTSHSLFSDVFSGLHVPTTPNQS